MMFGMIDPVEGQSFDTIGEADFRDHYGVDCEVQKWEVPPKNPRAPRADDPVLEEYSDYEQV